MKWRDVVFAADAAGAALLPVMSLGATRGSTRARSRQATAGKPDTLSIACRTS